jgi:hypothetical protein
MKRTLSLLTALLVTPPKGSETGYVPIVTRQEQDASRSNK